MMSHMFQEPLWLQVWIVWMIALNTASLFFVKYVPARWVLGAFVASGATMNALFEFNGYNRFLGLAHVLWWTPLLVYLDRIWDELPESRALHVYLSVLFYTNTGSLVLDYTDVFRYLVGV